MFYPEDLFYFEGRRNVKIESGNVKTGLSKVAKISRDHQPFDSNGQDKAGKQAEKGGKKC